MYLARIHASAAACFLVRLRPREPAVWTHTLSFATDAGSGLGGPSTDLIGVAFELSAADNLLMVKRHLPNRMKTHSSFCTFHTLLFSHHGSFDFTTQRTILLVYSFLM